MKDFQEDDERIEQTLVSIWKEFAWYLKEVAKRHDNLIETNKDKYLELMNIVTMLRHDFDTHIQNQKDDKRKEWTIAEKIVVIIGFMIMAGLALWANLKL